MLKKKIGIIGCGNMGEALIGRLLGITEKGSLAASEVDDAKRTFLQKKYGIAVAKDNAKVAALSDVIILAVKPKDIDAVLKDISPSISKTKILVSIAAGISTDYIAKVLAKDVPVVRVMPNMCAIIGEGISSISAGSSASIKDVNAAKEIFSTLGDVVEVRESLVDAVTAISGSGPAYFFYLIESLIESAEELGIDRETAKRLVYKTALGSSRLLDALNKTPQELRLGVTSKGGTTEAALKILESADFKNIMKKAARAARDRSKDISER